MRQATNPSLFPSFARAATYPFRLVARRWRVIVGVVLVVAVIASIATAILGYKVSRELARIKAEGDPVQVADLAGAPVPDSENGALIYLKVFKAIEPIESDTLFNEYWRDSTRASAVKDPQWWRDMRRVYTKHDGSYYKLVLQAQAKPKCRFKANWEDGPGALFPYLARLRSLSRVLCLRSVLMAHEGRSGEAVDSLIKAIRLQKAVADDPMLIHQLVRYAVVIMSTQAAADVVGRCRFSEEQAIVLDRELARVDLRQSVTIGLKGERTFGISIFRDVRGNPAIVHELLGGEQEAGWQRDLDWMYLNTIGRPILYADELTCLRLTGEHIGWSSVPYRESREKQGRFAAEERAVPRAFFMTSAFTPVFASAAKNRDGAMARVDGARTVIGLYRYRQQRGRYPQSLSALASGLKWTAPLDPFSGGPFRYNRQGSGFLLYSIGANLKDDGGVETTRRILGRDEGDIVWRG